MKRLLPALAAAACPLALWAQSSKTTPPPPHPDLPASMPVETEKVLPPGQTPGGTVPAEGSGSLEPAEVKALMHKVRLAEYRVDDLLTQVHPERWKMTAGGRQSFMVGLEALRKTLATQEDWRAQFEARPASLYLGFQTYVAIGAVLPRLQGVADAVSSHVSPGFGAQYSQAANQLFDLQQTLVPHLEYLLKSQDGVIQAIQGNLASCQNELNSAERDKAGHATPMKNIPPEFDRRGRSPHAAAAANSAKKNAAKKGAANKPAANPPQERKPSSRGLEGTPSSASH